MNISSRFTEFGMTGAFFWISQLIFFGLFNNQLLVDIIPQWVMVLDGYQPMIPAELHDTAGSLLTVFGVIGIFVTGLMLDLMGSYFAFSELSIFRNNIKRNQAWLNDLTKQCPENIRRDYQILRDHSDSTFLISPKEIWKRISMADEYKRIQTFLFSYIHVFSSMSETLVDNMHLWRTARAISTTLLILAVEVIYLNFLGDLLNWKYILANLVLFGLSAFITLRSYDRLCSTLFSLACATQEKAPQT